MAARKPNAPAAPTSPFADKTAITIDWKEPYNGGTPITSYKVQWNLGGTGVAFYDLATTNASTLSFTKSSLTTGEVYYFKVIANNLIGSSIDSGIL